MEPMHWEYMGALGGVIGIGWLVVVPMYRGWTHLNDKMTARVKRSIHLMSEYEDCERTLCGAAQAGFIAAPSPRRTDSPSTTTP